MLYDSPFDSPLRALQLTCINKSYKLRIYIASKVNIHMLKKDLYNLTFARHSVKMQICANHFNSTIMNMHLVKSSGNCSHYKFLKGSYKYQLPILHVGKSVGKISRYIFLQRAQI